MGHSRANDFPVPSFTKKTQITGKTSKYRKDHSKDMCEIEIVFGVWRDGYSLVVN